MHLFDKMYDGKVKGLFVVGTAPAVSSPNASKVRKALENLEWMVCENIFDNETHCFWKGPGVDPAKIKTEVFLLPASASMEKEGSQSNSGRWVQWKYKAARPPATRLRGRTHDPDHGGRQGTLCQRRGRLPGSRSELKWDYTDKSGRSSTP
jgi:formate dehydrogenase major subunit